MSDNPGTVLTRGDRMVPRFVVGVLALVVALATISQADIRGLLRWDDPSVLAVGGVEDLPDSYSVAYLGYGQNVFIRRTDGNTRGRAARFIPPRAGGGSSPLDERSPVASGGSPAALVEPPAAAAPPNNPPGNGTTGTGGDGGPGPNTFVPGNLGGSPAPPGVVFVSDEGENPVEPVVPAVPEPSAWLLMILGIGGLAYALRRQGAARSPAVMITSAG